MLLLKALLMTECVTQLDVRTAVPKVKMSISIRHPALYRFRRKFVLHISTLLV